MVDNRILIVVSIIFFLFTSSAFAVLSDNSIKVFAVSPDGTALSAKLFLHIEEGTGKVWSSVSGPLVGTATQSTEKIAIKVAKNYFPNTNGYDYFFTIDSEASVVDGPSAGSAMALLVVSTLEDKAIPSNVGLTGTITNAGEVGPVGGVFEKAHQASKDGIKLFLIPYGEARQVVKLSDGVKNINLPDYALKEWGLKVVETATLDQVLKYAFSDVSELDINKTMTPEEPTYIPDKIQASSAVQPMGELNKKFIQQTRDAIKEGQNSLNNTLLDDSGLIEILSRSLDDSEKTVNESELLNQNGYFYSAGNFAFLARVNAHFVQDVAKDPDLIDLASDRLDQRIEELSSLIETQQAQFDKAIPVEGIEWYIAAQQRLTWAEEQIGELQHTPVVMAATPDAEHAQAVSRVQDFEYAQAWYESSGEFYQVALQLSKKGIKTQEPFAEYYADFLTNTENGLSLIQDGTGDDAQRRLDSAKLDQLHNRHLSAAMNAASALAIVNGILIENDGEKDIRDTLESKIESLEGKLVKEPQKYGWAHLYLDHAKYYLNSANYYQGVNQGASAAASLNSGLSLILLAENTFEVTHDVEKYYDQLPPGQFVDLASIIGNYTPVSPSSNGNGGTLPSSSNTVPLNVDSEGKGSIVVQTGNGQESIPLSSSWILGIVVIFLGVVLLLTYASRARVNVKGIEETSGFTPVKEKEGAGSKVLFVVDELEAKLFSAKQGLRHAQYQHNNGQLSEEAFEEVEEHYTEQIRNASKELRKANSDLRMQEKKGRTFPKKIPSWREK